MSHFTVMVIGPDVKAQLAPFHEFECTGQDDQFVVEVDRTEEARKGYEYHVAGQKEKGEEPETFLAFVKDWYGLESVGGGTKYAEPDLQKQHKYGHVLLDNSGYLVKVIDRTNPNKKWDWWQVGGRWTNYFTLKPGRAGSLGEPSILMKDHVDDLGTADVCRKGDVDVEKMRDDAGLKAGAHYDLAAKTLGGRRFAPWPDFVAKVKSGEITIDQARDRYNEQAPVKELLQTSEFVFEDLEDFLLPREEYVQGARDRAVCPFAVLENGVWHEKGKMGWFGIALDEKEQSAWNAEFNRMFDALPDETLLTIVDCHI